MLTMAQLFDALAQERALFLEAVKDLPEITLERKGMVGGWSIKDVIGHLASWDSIVTNMLPERIRTGIMPDILQTIRADEDAWNAQEIAAAEHLSSQEQLARLNQNRVALLQVLENLGEEVINRAHPWPQWKGTVGEYILKALNEHDREHREIVLTALERV